MAKIEFAGKQWSISALARMFGIKPRTLNQRLRRGTPLLEALHTPSFKGKLIKIGGVKKNLSTLAREHGLCRSTLSSRRQNGWSKRELTLPRVYRDGLKFAGRKQTIKAWAKEIGMSSSTLTRRLRNLPVEEALTPHRLVRGRRITAWGRTQTLKAWANEKGLPPDALRKRLDAGTPPEAALTSPLDTSRRRKNRGNYDHQRETDHMDSLASAPGAGEVGDDQTVCPCDDRRILEPDAGSDNNLRGVESVGQRCA